MEAIAAVERKLARWLPNDERDEGVSHDALQVSSARASSASRRRRSRGSDEFNYEYVEQLGYQLAEENDPDRRDRGLAYLRIAGRGLPTRDRPSSRTRRYRR